MTILNVAYPFAPVSPDAIGGAEQVLAMLDQGLVTGGMESIVLAAKGAFASGALIEGPANQKIDDNVRHRVYLDILSPTAEKADFVLMLGRICPEKGFHLGLQAAAAVGITCLLAGQIYGYADHQNYFEREIRPRLDRQRRFIGPVGGKRKR